MDGKFGCQVNNVCFSKETFCFIHNFPQHIIPGEGEEIG